MSEIAMKNVFKKDLQRYYGGKGEPFLKKMFRPGVIRYIWVFRKANTCRFLPLKLFYMLYLMGLSHKTQIQIPARTSIGEGLYIGYPGMVVVNPEAKFGRNLTIETGVTVGMENRGKRQGTPTIGDNCFIGTNAVVVGNVKIGNNVTIAPLAYVNFDVPDNSYVEGNPGRIVKTEDL